MVVWVVGAYSDQTSRSDGVDPVSGGVGIVQQVLGDVSLEGLRWGTGPLSFRDPADVFAATDLADVEPALRAAQESAIGGNWVVGYVSYDAAPGLDPGLRTPGSTNLPLVWFAAYPSPAERQTSYRPTSVGQWTPTMNRDEHGSAVEAIREAIRAGDTYQTNLTFGMDARLDGNGVDLFRRMVRSQRNSFGAVIDLGAEQIVSLSPELFLRGHGRKVATRPMKGTAPRGRSSAEDNLRRDQLVASEKERAGNIMIVDLLRNDLGRVSVTGSVQAPSLFNPERYPTVWQLTSTVESELRPDVDLVQLFRATFPSGSVTGAPKRSTMSIIADLESTPRGVYSGAIGYIAPGGSDYEFSVAIRTGVVSDGTIRYHVGGGITSDSIAGSEYEECLWKALAVTAENAVPDLLETMLYEPNSGIELLPLHLARLAASAAYWEIPLNLEAVGEALSGIEGAHRQKVRLVLDSAGGVAVESHNLEIPTQPVELGLAAVRTDPSENLWYHKTVDRSHYPSNENREVVLVNLDGDVTETTISNLMVRLGDDWFTPPVSSGCLPGIFRQKMINDGLVAERTVSLDEFRSADEIAVTNAVRGWRKAVLVD